MPCAITAHYVNFTLEGTSSGLVERSCWVCIQSLRPRNLLPNCQHAFLTSCRFAGK